MSDISQENSEDSYLCMFSTHFASFIVLFFFSLLITILFFVHSH